MRGLFFALSMRGAALGSPGQASSWAANSTADKAESGMLHFLSPKPLYWRNLFTEFYKKSYTCLKLS
ncbi:MAG: hypothetical protein EBT98_13360 [Opitutaceae bacterium]|nr:hypothetical protein [Opitutaceae bacterium]